MAFFFLIIGDSKMLNKKNKGEKEFEGKYLDIWRSPINSNDEFDFRISKTGGITLWFTLSEFKELSKAVDDVTSDLKFPKLQTHLCSFANLNSNELKPQIGDFYQ